MSARTVKLRDMRSKTVVITGGNSGIGLETAVGLAGLGARVVIASRSPQRGAAAVEQIIRRSGNDAVESRNCDLSDLDSVERCAEELSSLGQIDVLVNNAGIVSNHRRETEQGFELTFGTNHLGHFHLTNLLIEKLLAAPEARIINLASVGHSASIGGIQWAEVDRFRRYDTWRVYGDSKLANILHAEALASRLEGSGVVAHSVHPGAVRTGFGRDGDTSGATAALMELNGLGERLGVLNSPEAGAATSLHLAASDEAAACNGLYWTRRSPTRPARWARRRGDTEALWSNSLRMIAAVR